MPPTDDNVQDNFDAARQTSHINKRGSKRAAEWQQGAGGVVGEDPRLGVAKEGRRATDSNA